MQEEVRESYLEIREVATGQVVTVIELFFPKNKRPGEGRNHYSAKRSQVLNSATHLIEIDLLRVDESLPILEIAESDYRILVSRASICPATDLYPFNLRDPIPVFPLLLEIDNHEPLIDLATLLNYDEAALDLAIDYTCPPRVKLNDHDWNWLQSRFKS